MLALYTVLADIITIKIGDHVWSFGLNLVVYLIIGGIVGLLAELLVKYRLPFGFIGAIIAALVGTWLMTQVVNITGIGDIYADGVPIFRALIGAVILVAIWRLLTFGLARRRYRTDRPARTNRTNRKAPAT